MAETTVDLHIDLQVASSETCLPAQTDIEQWVQYTLKHPGAGYQKPAAEVSIRIVDNTESQALNYEYRQKDRPTNVLSFPAELPEDVPVFLLGDLIICAPVVAYEAQAQRKTLAAHWAHMTIHGTLHLLGFDHIEEADAVEMETLETQILLQLGFPPPYESPPRTY